MARSIWFPYERLALQSNAYKLSLSAPLACEARAERAGALATRPRAERALRTQVAPNVQVYTRYLPRHKKKVERAIMSGVAVLPAMNGRTTPFVARAPGG